MATGERRAYQAIAGIGNQRHAGVGNQRHPLALPQCPHDARLGQVLGRIAIGHGGRGNTVVGGQFGEHAGVLAGNQVDRTQHVERAQRYVAHVTDRSGDNVQSRRDLLWFTRGLLVVSL